MLIAQITSKHAFTPKPPSRGLRIWIAKINGQDRRYGLNREFCKRFRSKKTKGKICFKLHGDGLYEHSNLIVDAQGRRQPSGFIWVDASGAFELEPNEAKAFARKLGS